MMFEGTQIMTLAEMADYLRIAKRSLLRMAQKGDIPATKVASQWRFMRSMVDDWLIARMKALPDRELQQLIESEKLPLPLPALIRPELVLLQVRGQDKEKALGQLVELLVRQKLVRDAEAFLERLMEREDMVSTAIFPGIAIPHFRKPEQCPVAEPRVVLGVSREGVEFDSLDGKPTHALFLICANQVIIHLKIIAELALLFRRCELVQELVRAPDVPAILEVIFRGRAAGPPSRGQGFA
jgi:PTS system nitrogen regulatory IIA component